MVAKAIRCPTCHRLKKRSNPANARYWLLLHLIADNVRDEDGQLHSADTWHVYFKCRFLGSEECKLPNKTVVQLPRSSADLDTTEFADYMLAVEQFGMKRNVYMEEMEPT